MRLSLFEQEQEGPRENPRERWLGTVAVTKSVLFHN